MEEPPKEPLSAAVLEALDEFDLDSRIELEDLLVSFPDQTASDIQSQVAEEAAYASLKSGPTESLPKRGELFMHQELFKRLMTTICDVMLLMARTGTGKSCSVAAVAQELKRMFIEETGHINKTLFLAKGDTVSEEFVNQLVTVCTTEYETEAVKHAKSNADRKGKITRLIKPNPGSPYRNKQFGYNVENWGAFTNALYTMKTERFKDDLTRYHLELKRLYSNTLIIVDEAHNLHVSCKSKSLYESLPANVRGEARPLPESVKSREEQKAEKKETKRAYKILHELFHVVENSKIILATATPMINDPCDIISLMNLILPLTEQMPEDFDVNSATKEELARYFRGRISYVRELETGINVTHEGLYYPPLKMSMFLSEMVDIQRGTFLKEWASTKETVHLDQRTSSLFVFPDGTHGTGNPPKETKLKPGRVKPIKAKKIREGGFTKNVTEVADISGKRAKMDKELAGMVILRPDGTNSLYSLSAKYSTIAEMCRNHDEINGCIFIYSDFDDIGAVLLGLCLEYYGFEKYDRSTSAFIKQKNAEGIDVTVINPSFKKRPRYALLTRQATPVSVFDSSIELFNSQDNILGDYIKIVVGSPMSREGINLMNVVQIHIISPWWNNSMSYQAQSRGIRATSHQHLLTYLRLLFATTQLMIQERYRENPKLLYDKYLAKLSRTSAEISRHYQGKIDQLVNLYSGRYGQYLIDMQMKWPSSSSEGKAPSGKVSLKRMTIARYLGAERPEEFFHSRIRRWTKRQQDAAIIAKRNEAQLAHLRTLGNNPDGWKAFYDLIIEQWDKRNAIIKVRIYNHVAIAFRDDIYADLHSRYTSNYAIPLPRNILEREFIHLMSPQVTSEGPLSIIQSPDSPIKSIDFLIYIFSHKKEIAIKRVYRIAKVCAIDAIILYNRNYRITDKDGSEICDYDKCDFRDEILDQTPVILGSKKMIHRLLYADDIIKEIADRIVRYFETQPPGTRITQNDLFQLIIKQLPEYLTRHYLIDPGNKTGDKKDGEFYFTNALEKLINQKRQIQTLFGYRSYLNVSDDMIYSTLQYPIYSQGDFFEGPKTDYETVYYEESLNLLIELPFMQYLEQFRQINPVDVIQEMVNESKRIPDILDALSLKDRIVLVEYVLEKIFLEGDTNDYHNLVYSRFLYAIYNVKEPARTIETFRQEIVASRMGKKDSVQGILTKPMKKRVPDIIVSEPNGDEIIIHTLRSRREKRVGYGTMPNIRKAPDFLRILRRRPGEHWRDANLYETAIYQKIIEKNIEERFARFDEMLIYGIMVDDRSGKFHIINKLHEDLTTLKKKKTDDISKSKQHRGRHCENFQMDALIDIVTYLGILPSAIQTPEDSEMRKLLAKHTKLSLSVRNRVEGMSSNDLRYYYSWIYAMDSTKICDIIKKHLLYDKHVMIEADFRTWSRQG